MSVNEMKSLTLNGKKYDSFPDQTARAAAAAKLPGPASAKVGQYLVVEEVDAEGKITNVKAVEAPSGGMSPEASALLITILRNAKYASDQSANITALEEALANGGGSGGEVAPSVYTVKNTLTNVSTNNPAVSIMGGEAYAATLTAVEGHVIDYIRVVMGGKDITNTAYSDGVINIASVTGNLEITVGASVVTSSEIMQIGNVLRITGGVTVTKTDDVLLIA